MRSGFAALVVVALAAGPALAEDDPMEAQRCIWRCLENSRGADDPAYARCARRECAGKPDRARKERANRDRRSEAPGPGRWIYGDHPRLGVSAHVEVGGEAFGLACPAPRANGEPHGYAVATRFTGGLSPSQAGADHLAVVWTGPFAVGGGGAHQWVGDVYQSESGYCASDVARIKTSGAMLLVREKMESLSSEGGVTRMTLAGANGSIAVETADDLTKLDAPTQIPLAGASRAIAQLAKACPSLKRQMSEGCEAD